MNKIIEIKPAKYKIVGNQAFLIEIKKNCKLFQMPKTIENEGKEYIVTTISDNAFLGCEKIKFLTIPNNIIHIGHSAFAFCYKLKNITISNSASYIGDSAFKYCTSLKEIVIPDNVNYIGLNCFEGCEKLKSIQLPKKLKVISEFCFSSCYSLKKITIPDEVTTIQEGAFNYCVCLKNINIPKKVVCIGKDAFYGCVELTKFNNGKYYKGFNSDLTCRKFQYKENEWFETDGKVELCVNGFHACHSPFYIFNYYYGTINKEVLFYEVDLDEVTGEDTINDFSLKNRTLNKSNLNNSEELTPIYTLPTSMICAKRIKLIKRYNSYSDLFKEFF
ncbi:MAG: leucine-rich repeat domain-containing protein [Clostridia bacterium]|nr:leucine-rich repeat domain-containing protein [Clostridia bacterium]